MVLVEVKGCGLRGGHKILSCCRDAQFFQLLHIILHALGGVVGHEQIVAAGLFQGVQQL